MIRDLIDTLQKPMALCERQLASSLVWARWVQEPLFPLAFFAEHMLRPITTDRALCVSQAVPGSLFEGISAIC